MKCNSSCKKHWCNFPYMKASLTGERVYAGAERAFIQQNRVAMLFLLFWFCQFFDLFECHGQSRNIVKDQIDDNTKPLRLKQIEFCRSLTGGRAFLFGFALLLKMNKEFYYTKPCDIFSLFNHFNLVKTRKCF